MHECLIPCSKERFIQRLQWGVSRTKIFVVTKVLLSGDVVWLNVVSFPLNFLVIPYARFSRRRTPKIIELIALFFHVDFPVFHLYCTYAATPTLWAGWRRPENWNKSDSKKIHAENKNEMNYVYDGGNSLRSPPALMTLLNDFSVSFSSVFWDLTRELQEWRDEEIWWEYRGIIACPL